MSGLREPDNIHLSRKRAVERMKRFRCGRRMKVGRVREGERVGRGEAG